MPSWVPGLLVTVAVSAASAYGFLRLRCRRLGRPFGPKARSSAIAVIVITVIISTGLGVAAVAVGHHLRAVYVGLVLPSGLWLGEVAAQRKRERDSLWPRQLTACLTFPVRRLDDGMGDDMKDWCDTRLRAALKPPPHLPDAAQYYYNQVAGRVKDERALEELDRWRKSIAHKTRIVRLINLGTGTSRLWTELRVSSRHKRDEQARRRRPVPPRPSPSERRGERIRPILGFSVPPGILQNADLRVQASASILKAEAGPWARPGTIANSASH